MKRRNVQMAFVGEGVSAENTAAEQLVEGDEAVDIDVRGGKLMVVVPAGTPDNQIFDDARTLGGELELENGLRFSFTLEEAAIGAQFAATRKKEREDTHEGLSSLPDVPSGT
ncbi:MAG: hypothetical protein IT306_08265 [Chloroflexi bacterium]|nr:hypothetical protein [Chloroflexota bacterium]